MLFGQYVRKTREDLLQKDKSYSVRQVAQRIGVEPAYLSKVERGHVAPPSEATIQKLASELDVNPDILLAMAGKVSSDLQEIIRARPQLIANLIRQLKQVPDMDVLKVLEEISGDK